MFLQQHRADANDRNARGERGAAGMRRGPGRGWGPGRACRAAERVGIKVRAPHGGRQRGRVQVGVVHAAVAHQVPEPAPRRSLSSSRATRKRGAPGLRTPRTAPAQRQNRLFLERRTKRHEAGAVLQRQLTASCVVSAGIRVPGAQPPVRCAGAWRGGDGRRAAPGLRVRARHVRHRRVLRHGRRHDGGRPAGRLRAVQALVHDRIRNLPAARARPSPPAHGASRPAVSRGAPASQPRRGPSTRVPPAIPAHTAGWPNQGSTVF